MAKAPTGTVECRDQALCGAKFHYSHTIAACGATKNTMRNAPLLNTAPKSTKADPNCPKHGIEPMGEYDVAALNRQQVAAGVVGAAAIFGLCSCSATPDPTGSVTPTVEQTIAPTADPSAEPTVEPSAEATGSPAPGEPWVVEDGWRIPDEMTFPSMTQDDYAFSVEPQGAAEEWIRDSHPDLWDAGVRAVTPQREPMWDFVSGYQPSTLVQYIDGERFEGSKLMPLGFGIHASDPDAVRSDSHKAAVSMTIDPSEPLINVGNPGVGGYTIAILENQRGGVGGGKDTELNVLRSGIQAAFVSDPMKFESPEDAWQWIQDNDFKPAGADRPLSKGELSLVKIVDQTSENHYTDKVLNPSTGKFEVVDTY